MPFGKGRQFAVQSRWLDAVVGGWLVNGIYTLQTGQSLTWMGTSSTTIGDLIYNGDKLNFNPRETNGLAFNTSAFDTKTANQFAYRIRTYSTTFSSLRGDGTNELNASMLKRFDLRPERQDLLTTKVRVPQLPQSPDVLIREPGPNQLSPRPDHVAKQALASHPTRRPLRLLRVSIHQIL